MERPARRQVPGYQPRTAARAAAAHARDNRAMTSIGTSDDSPAHAQRAFEQACALGAGGDDAGAEAAFRAILRRDPGHRAAAATLAHTFAENGRPNAAAEIVLQAHRAGAFDAVTAATFLRLCQRFEDAYAVCSAALTGQPADARLRSLAGTIALNLGRFDDAIVHLRGALDAAPEDAGAWLALARTKKFADSADPELALLERAAREGRASADAREAIGFALGKAYDDLGRFAAAATALDAANRSYRGRLQVTQADWRGELERALGQRWPAARTVDRGFRPLFVVGMPRSGTTLLATLLERHFGARNRGETHWVAETARRLGTVYIGADASDAAAAFLARQLRQDDADAPFHLDKNPLNFRYLRLVLALLPQARFIWLQRGARDTALSLWMQHFAHPDLAFAYAWTDIATTLQGHATLLEGSRDIDAGALLHLRYEDLVAAPAAAVQSIAAFLGVAASGAPRAARASGIATASLWQARQPVYADSVGRWRHYRGIVPELETLFDD